MPQGFVESYPVVKHVAETTPISNPRRSLVDIARGAAFGAYRYSGAMALQEYLASRRGGSFAAVVLFHRVTDEIPPDGLTVSTRWFRDFCQLMRDRFHVISMSELQRCLTANEAMPRRSVVITFDDCYKDNLAAARVLAEHGLPATFFVPTQFVETDHVFDWDIGLTRLANLTWNDVREMVQLGHSIGSHSVSHPDLGIVPSKQARFELLESKRVLEDRLEMPIRWFAYPFGGASNFRSCYWPLAQELGYDLCFSAMRGFVKPEDGVRVLPRIAMPPFRSMSHLEMKLSGCLEWFYAMKRRFGMQTA